MEGFELASFLFIAELPTSELSKLATDKSTRDVPLITHNSIHKRYGAQYLICLIKYVNF